MSVIFEEYCMLFINIMQLYMDIDRKCLGNVHMQLSLKLLIKVSMHQIS